MAEAILKYHTNANPPLEGAHSYGELRLLSVNQYKPKSPYGELALLSKREARTELRIGNEALNRLIRKGEIKVIPGEKRDKIPYVSIQEYINKMSFKEEPEIDKYECMSAEESVVIANKIIKEFKKGG